MNSNIIIFSEKRLRDFPEFLQKFHTFGNVFHA